MAYRYLVFCWSPVGRLEVPMGEEYVDDESLVDVELEVTDLFEVIHTADESGSGQA
jgi:hypothetical protein